MPCDCELDLERRWVRGRAWGVVTYDDAMEARRKFANNPNFTPDFFQIYDGSEVTRIALTASEVGALAAADVFGAGSLRAFVAPRRDTYDLARMFHMYRRLNSGQERIRIFRSMPEAEAWLAESSFGAFSTGARRA